MKINIPAHVGVGGQFSMEIRRHGKVRQVVPLQDNIILNRGLDWLLGSAGRAPMDMNTYCYVGTGNTVPAKSQTGMQGSWWNTTNTYASNSTTVIGGAALRTAFTRYYAFALGAVVGNIAEVGISAVNSGTGLTYTRALIKDSGGNPIVLTMTAEDQLYVAYTLYSQNVEPSTVTGVVSVLHPVTNAMVDVDYTIVPVGRTTSTAGNAPPIRVTSPWKHVGGAVAQESQATPNRNTLQSLSAAGAQATSTLEDYVNGQRRLTCNAVFGPTIANFTGGIGRIFIGTTSGAGASFCIVFPVDPLPKNSDCRLELSFTIHFASI